MWQLIFCPRHLFTFWDTLYSLNSTAKRNWIPSSSSSKVVKKNEKSRKASLYQYLFSNFDSPRKRHLWSTHTLVFMWQNWIFSLTLIPKDYRVQTSVWHAVVMVKYYSGDRFFIALLTDVKSIATASFLAQRGKNCKEWAKQEDLFASSFSHGGSA